MSNLPLISVIIPSYNHVQFIEQAIRSVLTQDYRPLEIVIVDDGSTDSSRDFINELLATKPAVPIKFIAQEKSGAHAAINRGIREAQGDVIAILNSDDFYYPQRFTTLLSHVPIEGEFLVFSELDLIDEASKRLPSENEHVKFYEAALANAAHSPAIGFALLRANCAMTSGNLVFSRGLFDKLGGFNNQKLCHDIDFLLRATYFLEPTFVRHKLMAYRIHHGNTTRSTQHLLFEEGMRAVNNFFDMCVDRAPDNDLAPVRANWPFYFNIFSARYPVFFSNQPLAAVLATADLGFPTRDAVAFSAVLVNELRLQEEAIAALQAQVQDSLTGNARLTEKLKAIDAALNRMADSTLKCNSVMTRV